MISEPWSKKKRAWRHDSQGLPLGVTHACCASCHSLRFLWPNCVWSLWSESESESDICIHSSSLLDQVRCHGNALQHFWSCRCLTNDTWHKSPNHRTIGNSTWLTLIPRLFWQDAGASVHAWEKDRFGDSGVGWIFGMVVIKSINLHWQMISTFCCAVVCRASKIRNLGSAGPLPCKEASQWPCYRAEYVAAKHCFCHQWLGVPNVDWWNVEPWKFSTSDCQPFKHCFFDVSCNYRQRFSQKLFLVDWINLVGLSWVSLMLWSWENCCLHAFFQHDFPKAWGQAFAFTMHYEQPMYTWSLLVRGLKIRGRSNPCVQGVLRSIGFFLLPTAIPFCSIL